ncbi:uncharacterized protein L969DRAFT_21613 [Mixia osmundae IAM 14324]|uniref:Uncharacterized protein n=1 Tax=Mixia osmundae (strain CBS 9802 / IAM 14324 / JCM 22182 / KY 12970) TaxID=764103 RepID=G7DT39_MIXOS|nr:uncharacterized protein L969DRAFT_21613 [Mixia osmundae IAM 14324]KEI42749.1 hypothetical protein L969DRAFT_21613 [Mixia osmundae IAM 14324]GAA93918.1 hypothetical protein E5Q_00564 [Mixia osmundae IAM 14324]
MGKSQKKTGKGRLDKWYKLAKEQGYRARSAFKLIQINKKYQFLESARCCIDLCAAPGGWLQVASKAMPPNSVIVGIDLVAIKPIARCVTIAEDITTDACRRAIRAEVKDWKADVVLHDGAPNVGTAWIQDAFTQAELVLASLKLATEFLAPGGTFVTKVFRSSDYNSLMFVFNQLFKRVEATKPPSSRNVSAEIFVVCQGFLAPRKIDPRFLDAKSVFSDLDMMAATSAKSAGEDTEAEGGKPRKINKLTPNALNVFHPEKKRRNREGYADGDYTLHHTTPANEYITTRDPIDLLARTNKISFESTEELELLKNAETTEDIRVSCEDLKVLGKREFKQLLKWRSKIRLQRGLDVKHVPAPEETAVEVEPLNEEEELEQEVDRLKTEEANRKRRDRRRLNEKKARDLQRMQLHMTTPADIGLERQDGMDNIFELSAIDGRSNRIGQTGFDSDDEESLRPSKPKQIIPHVEDESDEDEDISDEEELRIRQAERDLDRQYDSYQNRKLEKDSRYQVKEARKKRDAEEGVWGGIEDAAQSSEDEMTLGAASQKRARQLDSDDEEVDESDVEGDVDAEAEAIMASRGHVRSKEGKLIQSLVNKKAGTAETKARAADLWFDQPAFRDIQGLDALMGLEDASPSVPSSADEGKEEDEEVDMLPDIEDREDSDESGFEEVAMDADPDEWLKAGEEEEERKRERIERLGLTTVEAVSIAQRLVNREVTKDELLDEGFTRHAFNDKDGLPSWFLDDEMKHFRHNIPVTKEASDALKEKVRALNARPIKKIAEAKARKKMRTLRRLEKAQKKADTVNETDDITEKEKAASIAKILAKSGGNKPAKRREIKVVVAKGANRGQKGRPKGVKGRYKMVDPRGKKEIRAEKRIARRDAGKKPKSSRHH